MKTLVISDIHQNVKTCEKILEKQESSHDKIIFLGDYFDCFDFQPHVSVENTCDFLWETYKSLGSKAIWLVGNHDIPYIEELYSKGQWSRGLLSSNKRYFCSGYTRNKADTIRKKFSKDGKISFWENLKILHKDDNFLYSHAGFNHAHFILNMSEEENISRFEELWESFYSCMKKNLEINWNENFILDVGRSRGGQMLIGGPLWLDWHSEFSHISGINQIVGHSLGDSIRKCETSYCVDTHLKYYITIDSNGDVIKHTT